MIQVLKQQGGKKCQKLEARKMVGRVLILKDELDHETRSRGMSACGKMTRGG